jgi:hypothetical protein
MASDKLEKLYLGKKISNENKLFANKTCLSKLSLSIILTLHFKTIYFHENPELTCMKGWMKFQKLSRK